MPRYSFGEYVIDTDAVEVDGPDGALDLEPQVFDVLRYLVEQRGRLVTKEELLDNIWGDRFVSESALTTRIKQARRALRDDGRTQWAIKTIHGRGYRFIPQIDVLGDGVPADESLAGSPRSPSPLPEELQADARQLFCGRESELLQSVAVLARASPGDAFGWIWFLGEPGIGKTRLAAEVARDAHRRGHRVLFGRNNEDLRVPYQPFIEVIRAAIAELGPADQSEALARIPAELAPLLPEVGDVGAPAASSAGRAHGDTSIDNETRRYRLYEAIAGWLIESSAGAPLTMIVDDVHWAADSTLQLLAHLQRRQGEGAVNLVITARDTAPDINPRVADLLAAGLGLPNSVIVRLSGLSGEDAVKLVGENVELAEIMRQTAGNPLLLQAVNPADGSVDMQSAVRRRLASLDEAVQESLRLVSVLGLEFELAVAAAATRRDELDLLDDLEQAISARLLDDIGVDRFRFTHALIRSSLRDQLSSTRRARMHERIAEAIGQVFADDQRHLPALAFHTAEAAAADSRLRPLAIERLGQAAEESMAQLSFDEAAALLERARGLAGVKDSALAARLALAQGIAETRAGKNVIASRTFDYAVSAARSSGDPVLRVESALRYEDATWRPGFSGVRSLERIAEAIEVLDRALAEGVSLGDELELRTRLAIGRLRALAFAGQREDVEQAFHQAQQLARQLDEPNLEANLLNVYLGHVRFVQGLGDTAHLIDRLAALEARIDDPDIALHAIQIRALHATMSGHFDQHRRLVREMARLQESSHSSFWTFIRVNQEAMEALYRGDLEAGERLAEECLRLADDLPEEDGSGTYGLRMFMIRREQDRLAAMAPLVRHVISLGDTGGVWTPGLALLLIETGSPDEAAEVLRAIKDQSFELPLDAMWSTVMVLLIETMVHLGDVDSCNALRDRFAQLAGSNVTTGAGLLCFGRAERYLGMLSLTMGELGAAEEYLGVALEADSAGGSAIWSNESRLWLSRARRAQGHSTEADAMLAVVAERARGAGLRRLERIASAELAS